MTRRGDETVFTAASRQEELYKKFKARCVKDGITIKTGIREALLIWLYRQQSDEEFTRYLTQLETNREIIARLRDAWDCEELSDAVAGIEKILKEY